MTGRFGWVLAIGCVSGALSGCRDEKPSGDQNGDSADAAVTMPTATAREGGPQRRVHWNPTLRRERLPCKSIGVDGWATFADPKFDGGPAALGIGNDVPNGVWVDLADKAKVTTKDPRTGRELAFQGPARVVPCMPSEDEAWLVSGAFASIPGTGEGPGSEEWVVTALGVVRYGAAVVRVTAVDPEHVDIRVATGSASLWALEGTLLGDGGSSPDEGGWRRLEGGAAVKWTARKTQKPNREDDARDASNRCASAARSARELATQIAAPDAALGDLAPRHVNARQNARAACSGARLRADALPPSDARAALIA